MINNPDSLCHRVFKARFFPESSILEVRDSKCGSYAWKSILNARDVIRKGIVWCIGNGQSVRIKQDKWLPNQSSRTPISAFPEFPQDAKVSAFINSESGEWKKEVVQSNFLPHEAAAILGIPISSRALPDRIIWALTPSGLFSISIAYKMLALCASNELAGSSNPAPTRRFWRGIRQLRMPKKNSTLHLESLSQCVSCQITNSIVCELCKSHEEDTMNATWSCREIACLWNSFTWFHQVVASPPSDFTDLFSRFLQVQDDFSSEIFSTTAWLICNRRNAQHFGRLVHPLGNLCSMARSLLQEFVTA